MNLDNASCCPGSSRRWAAGPSRRLRGKRRSNRCTATSVDMILLDVRLPGISGMETLARIRQQDATKPVLLITAHADLREAVSAMKSGADDYLAKPVDLDELRVAVLDALGLSARSADDSGPPLPPLPAGLVFESPAMRHLLHTVAVVAPSDAPGTDSR